MFKNILLLIFILISLYKNQSYGIEIHPIIGYEKVQRSYPVDHSSSRLIYGARLIVGPSLLSVEAEATTGQDKKDFPNQNLTLKETVYNGMLGLRSSVNLAFINVYARAGGHIRKTEREVTENNVTTKTEPASYVSPYAGAGLYVGPGPIKVHAGVTAIFTGRPKSDDVEYQYTAGLRIGF
jgi:hypothetical protein